MLELKTYKNWKEICEVMGWKTTRGNYKNARLKELNSICKNHKEGQKIVIDEIYTKRKEIIDNRGKNENSHHNKRFNFENFKIDKKDENNIGVYRIINYDTKEVYIGSTVKGFRIRFMQHNCNNRKKMKHTYNLLHNGGVFEILESMNDCSEKDIRLREQYYIDKYNKDNNYILINNRNEIGNKLKNKKHFAKIKIEDKYLDLATKLLNENGIEIY